MPALPNHLAIGQLAERSGIAPSAIRFYEQQGLIRAERTAGKQRRYPRSTLRLIAFIRAAQSIGATLAEIREAQSALPAERVPTLEDWGRLSSAWRVRLDARISELETLRDALTSCIGCGCLSLRKCGLFNRGDGVATGGPGPRLLYPRGLPVRRYTK